MFLYYKEIFVYLFIKVCKMVEVKIIINSEVEKYFKKEKLLVVMRHDLKSGKMTMIFNFHLFLITQIRSFCATFFYYVLKKLC